MATAKKPSMPDGLPTRFDDPDSGFGQLCEFLEIANRAQQQSILNIEAVRRAVRSRKAAAQKLSTAKRLRMQLTAFYRLAAGRRALWQYTQNAPSDAPSAVPSLERHALRAYDPKFADRDVDDERVVKALADFPDAVESIADVPEWQRPALAVWPDLKQDLIEWDTLKAHRKNAAALAVFAVATILDDSRFLHWAADRVDALADEFSFVRTANGKGSEQATMVKERPGADATEPKAAEENAAASTRGIPYTDVSNTI